MADHQSAGRGRLGRSWEAPAGSNLLISVLLRPALPAGLRHLASAVVALAALDAADTVAGVRLDLKWPNDLLGPDGRKVAGVLAEADLAEADPEAREPAGPNGSRPDASAALPPIVVGIGVNVNWPADEGDLPEALAGTATSLRLLTGRTVERDALLAALLEALEPRVADLSTADGRRRQAADLRARCATIGTRVRVELAGERFEGTATGVTDEGHLEVDVGGAMREVVAGDVVHLRPAD